MARGHIQNLDNHRSTDPSPEIHVSLIQIQIQPISISIFNSYIHILIGDILPIMQAAMCATNKDVKPQDMAFNLPK